MSFDDPFATTAAKVAEVLGVASNGSRKTLAETFLKIYRMDPPELDGRRGIHYKTLPGADESNIEDRAAEFGSGKWKGERWKKYTDGTTELDESWTRTFSTGGVESLDKSGNKLKKSYGDEQMLDASGSYIPDIMPSVSASPDGRVLMAGNSYRGRAEEYVAMLNNQINALVVQLKEKDTRMLEMMKSISESQDTIRSMKAQIEIATYHAEASKREYALAQEAARNEMTRRERELVEKVETREQMWKDRYDALEERHKNDLASVRERMINESRNTRDPMDYALKFAEILKPAESSKKDNQEDYFETMKKRMELEVMVRNHIDDMYGRKEEPEEKPEPPQPSNIEKVKEIVEMGVGSIANLIGALKKDTNQQQSTNGGSSTASKPYAGAGFKDMLQIGLGQLPNYNDWASQAVNHLETDGAVALMQVADGNSLGEWFNHVPGLGIDNLRVALENNAQRQEWLQNAVMALKSRIAMIAGGK